MRRVCPALLAIFALVACRELSAAPEKAVLEAETQRIAAMDKAKNSVVAVFMPNGQGGGSGVVVSPDGYVVTNYHVAHPCGKAMLCGMADGNVYNAVLVGLDPVGDVALIKMFGREDFPTAELADSDQVRVGDWAFAMGNPFLLAADMTPTVTCGIISGVHRYQFPAGTLLEYTDCLQTDAAINPGNSGGPLFDGQGRLIGINGRCSFEKRGRVSVGVGYAISINQVKHFLGVLRAGQIVDHATLGAQVASDADGRAVVQNILETSDAFRRGLRMDDEIISFGGRPITSANGFKNVLGIYPKGWRVPLSFQRDGKRYDVLVRLAGVHGEEELIQKASGKPQLPVPKPEDSPKEGDAKGKKAPQPRKLPEGKPSAGESGGEAAVPEIVQKNFREKRGFANYHFNVLEQERVWNAWQGRTDLGAIRGTWTLAGPLEGNGSFRFVVDDKSAVLKLPSREDRWEAGEELGSSLLPRGSGGLLPALYLWRRLATEGLAGFGAVHYFGTAPLVGHAGLVDVLVGSYKGVDCRYYFDPEAGRLLALEFFHDDESDPCEVYFSEYHQSGNHWVPGRMEVRFGNEPFAVFKLQEFRVER